MNNENNVDANHIVLDIPANLQYVYMLSRCACALISESQELHEADSTLYNLELAIQEIGVNIITHAYAERQGRVVMTAIHDREHCEIEITLQDTGTAFNPQAVAAPVLGSLQEHGFGLFLAQELLDELNYEAKPTGNCWHLKKKYMLYQANEN